MQEQATKEAYGLVGVAAAWHLRKAQISELEEVTDTHHGATEGRQISGSPGRSCLYPPLGAVPLHILFSSAFKGHMEAAVFVKRMSEGDCRGEQ